MRPLISGVFIHEHKLTAPCRSLKSSAPAYQPIRGPFQRRIPQQIQQQQQQQAAATTRPVSYRVVPPGYTCHKCNEKGHHITECDIDSNSDKMHPKRTTGIPRSMLQNVAADAEDIDSDQKILVAPDGHRVIVQPDRCVPSFFSLIRKMRILIRLKCRFQPGTREDKSNVCGRCTGRTR